MLVFLPNLTARSGQDQVAVRGSADSGPRSFLTPTWSTPLATEQLQPQGDNRCLLLSPWAPMSQVEGLRASVT